MYPKTWGKIKNNAHMHYLKSIRGDNSMAKWRFIGNGRIKDETLGLVWFIDGFHQEDIELDPMNIEQKDYTSIKVRSYLRVFRFAYPINYLSVEKKRREEEIVTDLVRFQQVEYFREEHPLAGQIKSIIF